MQNHDRLTGLDLPSEGLSMDDAVAEASTGAVPELQLLGEEAERTARSRLFDEVLAGVELVLAADGVAIWREEPDHHLELTASRSVPRDVLEALDREVVGALQSIMQRWPDSPLVAVPLDDPANPIAEEIRSLAEREGVVGLAGVPCRTPGEMMGLLVVMHRRPHSWTVRELGLATGFAGQLATALQNARLYSSIRSLANRLAAIHELSLRLAQLRDLDAIQEAIVAEVGRLVECDTVRIYRPDPEDGAYRVVASSGIEDAEDASVDAPRLVHGETLPGWVARRNESIVVPDSSVERGSIRRLAPGPESVLLVPMAYGDDVLGVLVVSRAGANRYGPDDEQALSIFGRYAGQAMINAANIDRLERQQATLEQQLAGERRLLDISEQLVSTLDPREVLEQIADTIATVVRFDRLTIYRVDPASGKIEAAISRSPSGEGRATDPEVASIDEGLTGWVVGRGDAVCANGVTGGSLSAALRQAREGDGAESSGGVGELRPGSGSGEGQNLIVVPLRVHGNVVGSLNLRRDGGAATEFSEPEFDLCKLFAGQASIALQNAEVHETVATRADLDSLTGLRNHGTFQRDLDALIEKGDPFSLLMMDLDSFKAYNDTFGHPAGDELLRTVAQAVVGATRQNDRAYRYGGDEFALLLVGPGGAHSDDVARRIRAAVRDSVAAVHPSAAGLRFGVSIGSSRWPDEGWAKADLVAAADAALYEAKRSRADTRAAAEATSAGTPSAALLEAAADVLRSESATGLADALARHAAAIGGSGAAFVALPDATTRGSAAGATDRHSLAVVARSGRLGEVASPIAGGDGLWGQAWASGRVMSEPQSDDELLVALPLPAGSAPVGVLGVAVAASGRSERLDALEHLAAIAGAALRRLSVRNGTGGPARR